MRRSAEGFRASATEGQGGAADPRRDEGKQLGTSTRQRPAADNISSDACAASAPRLKTNVGNLDMHRMRMAAAGYAVAPIEDQGALALRKMEGNKTEGIVTLTPMRLRLIEGERPMPTTTPLVSGAKRLPAVAVLAILFNLHTANDIPLGYSGGHALNHGGVRRPAMVVVCRVEPQRDTIPYGVALIIRLFSGGHALNHGGVRRPAMVMVSRVEPRRKNKLYRL